MDRSVAFTHLLLAGTALVAGIVLVVTHPKLEMMHALGQPVPPAHIQWEALRVLGLHLTIVGAVLALCGGALLLLVGPGRAPVPAELYMLGAPIVGAATIGAGLATPPDTLSMLLLLTATLVVLAPIVVGVFAILRTFDHSITKSRREKAL